MTCIACKLQFLTPEDQKIHFKSDFHRYNLKRKVLGLDFVTLVEFEAKNRVTVVPVVPEEKKKLGRHEKRLEMKRQKEALYDDLLNGKTPTVDLYTCPMCNDKIDDVQHLTLHGFFVPPQTENLLSFIHTKVSIINSCLYCDKQFYSKEQVVHHMKSAGHFKLNDIDFEQFAQVDEGDEGEWEDESVVGEVMENEKIAYVDDNEELTLPNGKVLGSRHLLRYYKQNLTSSVAHGNLPVMMNQKTALISSRGGAGQLIKSHTEMIKEKQVKNASLKELKRGNDFRSRVGQKQNMLQHFYREQNPF
jgi:pre-60S factor REI1